MIYVMCKNLCIYIRVCGYIYIKMATPHTSATPCNMLCGYIVYVYVYACIYYICVCEYICICIYMATPHTPATPGAMDIVYMYTSGYIYIYIYIYTHTHTHTHTHIDACMHITICACRVWLLRIPSQLLVTCYLCV